MIDKYSRNIGNVVNDIFSGLARKVLFRPRRGQARKDSVGEVRQRPERADPERTGDGEA